MKTWNTFDKSEWERGPWDNEPDKAYWVDPETDFDCLIVRNKSGGNLCGYVGVPEGHELYEQDYSKNYHLECHGGLTFSGHCVETNDESRYICHPKISGRPEKVWWLGFDCAHSKDISPGRDAQYKKNGFGSTNDWDACYCHFNYVKREVEELDRQIKFGVKEEA